MPTPSTLPLGLACPATLSESLGPKVVQIFQAVMHLWLLQLLCTESGLVLLPTLSLFECDSITAGVWVRKPLGCLWVQGFITQPAHQGLLVTNWVLGVFLGNAFQ